MIAGESWERNILAFPREVSKGSGIIIISSISFIIIFADDNSRFSGGLWPLSSPTCHRGTSQTGHKLDSWNLLNFTIEHRDRDKVKTSIRILTSQTLRLWDHVRETKMELTLLRLQKHNSRPLTDFWPCLNCMPDCKHTNHYQQVKRHFR